MKKKIIAVLSLIFCLSLFLFACDNSASAEIEFDGFKAPTYGDTYYVGEEITLKKLTVEDTKGNEYQAVITVRDPNGETVIKKKTSGSFTPEIAGDYAIHYVVLDENEEEIARKTTTITVIVKNNNNNGGNGGNNGGNSTTLSIASQFGTPVAWGNNNEVTVSGNKITVNKKVAESAYAGMAFQNLNFTVSDPEQQVTLTVKNNTGSSVKAKYKATTNGRYKPSWGNTGEGFGAEDVIANANATASKSFHVLTYDQKDTANKITQVEIYIVTDATSGTIEIGLTLGSSSGGNGGGNVNPTPTDPRDAHTKSVLGNMTTTYGNDEFYTVSGTRVTVKKANTIGSGSYAGYLGVQWTSISGYSKTVDKSISFTVTNTTGGVVTLKYKAPDPAKPTDDNSAVYFDFEIPAGATNYEVKTNINGATDKDMTTLGSITLFIGNTTGRGTIDIVPKLSSEVIKYGNAVNLTQPTGATISADKQSAEEGETVTLSYNLTNAEAYEFGGFKVNGTAIDGNTFIMPDEDVTVSATVNKVKNIITLERTNAGTITAKVNGASVTAAAIGEEITFAVDNVKTGYTLTGFKVNGTAIDGNTFVMANADITVSATFTQTAYYVIVNQPSNGGSITVTANGNAVGNVPFDNGTEITLSNTPNANYKFVKYVVNGADTTESLVTINGRDLTISAVFEQNVFTITKTNPTGATITAPATAEKGTTVTLDYSLSDNYTFDGWTVKDASGNTITVNNNQFTMPSSNVTVTAKVKLLSATATVTKAWKDGNFTATKVNDSTISVSSSQSWTGDYNGGYANINASGYRQITMTITNTSSKNLSLNVSVLKYVDNQYSAAYKTQAVTVGANSSETITITLTEDAVGNGTETSVRFAPTVAFDGGMFTVSDFIIG